MLYREHPTLFHDDAGKPFFRLTDSDTGETVRVSIELEGFDTHFSDAKRWTLEREHWEGIKSSIAKTAADLYQDGKVESDGSIVIRPEHFTGTAKEIWNGTWPW